MHALERQRVLGAHVQETEFASGRNGGDRHRLDNGERVAGKEDMILEGARLRFVGVADEVVGLRRLPADGIPLAAGRERGAAAAHQL